MDMNAIFLKSPNVKGGSSQMLTFDDKGEGGGSENTQNMLT
jgi:hypothetical protein